MSAFLSIAFPNTPPLSIFLLPALYYTPVTASLMEWISVLLITFFSPTLIETLIFNADFIGVRLVIQLTATAALSLVEWKMMNTVEGAAKNHTRIDILQKEIWLKYKICDESTFSFPISATSPLPLEFMFEK